MRSKEGMSEAPNPFAGFTNDQLEILDDMADEWSDKDRHGFLESEREYTASDLSAFYAMSEALQAERRKRRLTYC